MASRSRRSFEFRLERQALITTKSSDVVAVVGPGEVQLGPDAAPSSGYTAARDSITSTLLAAALSWGDAASTKRPTRLASP